MASVFKLCITGLLLGKLVQRTDVALSSPTRQTSHLVTVKAGENLTLKCFTDIGSAAKLYWYKHSLGEKPRLISTFYKFGGGSLFHGEFKNKSRFTLDNNNGKNHLIITDVHTSDSAAYYCVSCYIYLVEFLVAVTVNVKASGSNVPALVHQSVSGSLHPGGSVTLNCTVHPGTCDEQHSVYWFRDSGQTQPSIIYTHGDRNDQCERKPDTQGYNTSSCVYNLPLNNLNPSHAGTYYCAVDSCGHILFGNGTKLHIEDNVASLVYFLSGALTFFIVLAICLVFALYKNRIFSQSTEPQASLSSTHTTNTEAAENGENLHYAALSAIRSRRQKDETNPDCVYSSVKL